VAYEIGESRFSFFGFDSEVFFFFPTNFFFYVTSAYLAGSERVQSVVGCDVVFFFFFFFFFFFSSFIPSAYLSVVSYTVR